MKLYVANCTAQVHDFTYRMLETDSVRRQRIEMFAQVQITGDLNQLEVDYIVKQYAVYGLVRVDEIDRTKPFIGMCWQVDKPIAVEKIRRALEHNKLVLDEMGRKFRQEAAIATNNRLQSGLVDGNGNPIGPQLTALEMSVQEEREGQIGDHVPIAEGVRVTAAEAPTTRPTKRRRRG